MKLSMRFLYDILIHPCEYLEGAVLLLWRHGLIQALPTRRSRRAWMVRIVKFGL